MNFNIFGGIKILWIFLGGHHKIGLYLEVISMHLRVEKRIFFGLLKFQIFIWGPEPKYEEKMRVPPSSGVCSNLPLLNAYKWAFVLVGFCPSGLLSQWAFVQWAFVLVGFGPTLHGGMPL